MTWGMHRQGACLNASQHRAFRNPSYSWPIYFLKLFSHIEAASTSFRSGVPSARIGEEGQILLRYEHFGMREIRRPLIEQAQDMIVVDMGPQYTLDLF